MKHGYFLIDKPVGLSSAAVVAKVKRAIGRLKTGHAGTLDPMATGLLVVVFGSCTKLMNRVQASEKEYQGRILFGRVTDSDDVTGATISESSNVPEFPVIVRAAESFVGRIMQAPPRISAVKIGGERSYELARAGEDVAPQPREVTVNEFKLEPYSLTEVRYRVRCSKGTYIRSLARDLGAALGCGGCLSEIRRTANGCFSVNDAVTLEGVSLNVAKSWWTLFPGAKTVEISPQLLRRLVNGDTTAPREVAAGETTGVVLYRSESSQPIGFVELLAGEWQRGPLLVE